MAAKEELREKARQVHTQVKEQGKVVVRLPALLHGAELLIRFLLGGMLAGAEVFGGYAPFGLGLVAASGSGTGAFAALLGSCFGYMAFRGFADGLPYVAACILTFSVSFAFFDVRLFQRAWSMPVTAALLGGVTGFVYLSDELAGMPQAVFFATELLLVAASAYFYRIALSPWEERGEENDLSPRQSASLLILGCTLLISLAGVQLWSGISLGCLLAAAAVMVAGWKGGAGVGAAVGICAGLAMDLALGQAPQYTMAYGFSGLMAGVFWKQGKLFAALTYVLANASVVLWLWEEGPALGILYEVFIASVIFMVLPDKLLRRAGIFLTREQAVQEGDRARAYVRERLERMSDAFRELYDGLRTSFRRTTSNDADGACLFHRAANQVCVRCALQDRCWQREYAGTMNALNDALPAMLQRGRGEAEDFPMHFRSRCISFPLFLATANEELTALLYRRQYQSRARDGRAAVCRQYGIMAHSLEEAARQLEEEPVHDPNREKKLRQHLAALGIEGSASVWYDQAGHLVAEVAGKELDKLGAAGELSRLSVLLGTPLAKPEERKEGRSVCLRFRQAEPLMAVAGVSARKRSGETVSGDAGAWFKTEDGGLFVLLCDGMGSGPDAHRESTLAIRLLEKFLRAGVEPEDALKTLNAGLALRGEAEGGFTTIDLLRLDLFTGEVGIYKLGAAPTYVKRKGLVSRVTGASFPAGLNGGENSGPDVARLRLEDGDCVVMVSDGVTTGEEDGWLKTALTAFDGTDPKGLAALLMEQSADRAGAADDRTAVVLAVKRR